jgi:polar amino acid transport system substrate-binding protein
MTRLLLASVLTLFASLSFAQTYTLLTSVPSKVAKGETSTEGFFIEVLTETFKRAEVGLRVKKDAWVRNQQKVANSLADHKLVIAPLTRTAERENKFDWILPITSYKLVFVTNDRSIDISNIEALKQNPVCVYRESPAEFKLRELGFEKIRARVQEQKCFQGLKKGREKVMLSHGKIAAIKGIKLVKGKPEKLRFGKVFDEETLFLASTPGAVSALDKKRLKKALQSMKSDGSFEAIRNKYL